MKKRLTLTISQEIITKAKIFAKAQRISLSTIVENYLATLEDHNPASEISPLVKSLTGMIPDAGTDYKKEYREFILKKYS